MVTEIRLGDFNKLLPKPARAPAIGAAVKVAGDFFNGGSVNFKGIPLTIQFGFLDANRTLLVEPRVEPWKIDYTDGFSEEVAYEVLYRLAPLIGDPFISAGGDPERTAEAVSGAIFGIAMVFDDGTVDNIESGEQYAPVLCCGTEKGYLLLPHEYWEFHDFAISAGMTPFEEKYGF